MIPSNMTSLQTHANQSTNNKIETHSLKSLTMASNVQQVELDSFFPFDPYRLPHTQKYLKDIFRNWDEVAIGDEEDEESDEESETNPSQSLGKVSFYFIHFIIYLFTRFFSHLKQCQLVLLGKVKLE